MMSQIRIGISGWRYKGWRKVFYPQDLAQRRELEYASRRMNSIEINGSFYSLQTPECYGDWYAETPDDFVFAVKGGRFITHMKRLKDVRVPLANFLASGVLRLRHKLGPILWQFPPQMRFSIEKFETFFRMLPRDTRAMAKLAREHNDKLQGRAWTHADANIPVRHAIEVRHESFQSAEFIQLLREHNVALVFADTAQRWPYMEDVTADFIYIRLHGAEQLYVSGYTDAALDWWAERIRAWRSGKEPRDAHRILVPTSSRTSRDVYVYFDNDAKVRAPFDAISLAQRLRASPLPQKAKPRSHRTAANA